MKQARLVMTALVCSECGHGYDKTDTRAFASQSDPSCGMCPACTILSDLASSEAWAVRNDCQGVFTSAVYATEGGAISGLQEFAETSGCTVTKVRVVPLDRHRKSRQNPRN